MAPENRLQALFDLLTALSSTLELEEVLSLFTARAAELTGSSSAELSLVHPDGETVIMLTDWSGNWGTTVGDAYSEAGETYPMHRFADDPPGDRGAAPRAVPRLGRLGRAGAARVDRAVRHHDRR